ncbi:putative group protein [Ilyonectria robusta]
MDPLSITTSCITLIGVTAKTVISLTDFIRTCRDARSDLFSVHAELSELTLVLELLKDDASTIVTIPQTLQNQVVNIVNKCGAVVDDISALLVKHNGKKNGAMRWAWDGKDAVNALRQSLETHRAALMLAVEAIQLCLVKDIKADTAAIRDESSQVKKNTDEILEEVARLRILLSEQTKSGRDFMMERYLDSLTTYAESVVSGDIDEDRLILSDDQPIPSKAHEVPSGIVTQLRPEDSRGSTLMDISPYRSHEYRASRWSGRFTREESQRLSPELHSTRRDEEASRQRSKSVINAPPSTNSGRQILHYARALYRYYAVIPEELGFAKGDLLAVFRHQDDGWWEAEVHGQDGHSGLVPSNFLLDLSIKSSDTNSAK